MSTTVIKGGGEVTVPENTILVNLHADLYIVCSIQEPSLNKVLHVGTADIGSVRQQDRFTICTCKFLCSLYRWIFGGWFSEEIDIYSIIGIQLCIYFTSCFRFSSFINLR